MSKKILTDIDLGGNEVIKSRVENVLTNPTDALKAGRVWQNTTDKEIYYYDGSKIKKLSGAGLPFEVEILETICQNVSFTTTSTTYTLPEAITLDDDALYCLEYKWYSDSSSTQPDEVYCFLSRVQYDGDTGDECVSWYGDDVTLTSTSVDTSMSFGLSTASIYKVSINITDEMMYCAFQNEGYLTAASGNYSHAEGYETLASGNYSHAEGEKTVASGKHSHAEGYKTEASGSNSHVEGYRTLATGEASHAEGDHAAATGDASHAEGEETIAASDYQHVQGKYNVQDASDVYAHIVGNGIYGEPSNAHTLDWNGNAWFAGDVYIGSAGGINKDEGSKKLATIDQIPTKTSDLTNNSGFITEYTETDPTVPDWAKNKTKPSYTASEVGAVPTSRKINGQELTKDIEISAGAKEQVLISTDITLADEHNNKQLIVIQHQQLSDTYAEVVSDTTVSQVYTSSIYVGTSYQFDSVTGLYTVGQGSSCAVNTSGASRAIGKYFIDSSGTSGTFSGEIMYYIETAGYVSDDRSVEMTLIPYTREHPIMFGDTSVSISENTTFPDCAEIELYSKDGTINLTIPEAITVITSDGIKQGGNFEVLQGDNKTLKCLTAIDSTNKTWGLYGGLDNLKIEYYTVIISGDVTQYASAISPVTVDGTVCADEAILTVAKGTLIKVQSYRSSTRNTCSITYNGVTVTEHGSEPSDLNMRCEYEFFVSKNTTIDFIYTSTTNSADYTCNIVSL